MLPFWAMREPGAARAVYSHHTAANALNDFLRLIPDGDREYTTAVREFALRLYGSVAGSRLIFLDKTPRYYLMINLLKATFPEAKFVLLTRHPLSVLASICETFYNGRFIWMEYWIDWIVGHRQLAAAVRESGNNAMVVHYEHLVEQPAQVLQTLCQWLGIAFLEDMVSTYRNADVRGRMGDTRGIKSYSGVSTASVGKWREFFGTAYRRRVVRTMLDRLERADLETLGYPRADIDVSLNEMPLRTTLDLKGRLEGMINCFAYLIDYKYVQTRLRASHDNLEMTYGWYRV